MTSKELREKRAELVPQMREVNDKADAEKRDMTADETEKWDKINAEYKSLSEQIDSAEQRAKRCEQLASMEADQKRVDDTQVENREYDAREEANRGASENGKPATAEDRAMALQAWIWSGEDADGFDLTEAHHRAAKRCGIRMNSKVLTFKRRDHRIVRKEFRAQSFGVDTAGGITVPEGFISSLERAELAFGGMRQVSAIMQTDTGEKLLWPTTDDTGNTGEIINENTAVDEQDVTFGGITFQSYKFSSKMIKVSFELLRDSAFNMAAELGAMLGERLGRIQNTVFTTGSGSSRPFGITVRAATGKTTASSTAITPDEILDLIHSIDPAYRSDPGVGFLFHDNIMLALRKLKDGDGQYIWAPGMTSGQPDRLWNFPVTINQDMSSTITNADITMVFGALTKYKIRDVGSLRLKRLDERYAELDQSAFLAFTEHDGNLLDAGTNPVKKMVQG